MLYQIIETKRGKDTTKMVDSLTKCNNRIKELRTSFRGKKVTFRIEPSTQTDKYEQKPKPKDYLGGDYPTIPPKIRK